MADKPADDRPADEKAPAKKAPAKKAPPKKAPAKKASESKTAAADKLEAKPAPPAQTEAAAPKRPRSRASKPDRVAIVGALRSPFVKSWSTLSDVSPVELSTQVSRELLYSLDLPPEELDHIVWGTVIAVPTAPNVGREVALNLGLYSVPAVTVSRACATGFQSVADAARLLLLDEADVVLAGGVDVTSAAPVPHKKELIDQLLKLQKAKGLQAVQTLAHLNPKDLLPSPPSISERYTGRTMGEHAEEMAVLWDISRADQDALAMESHKKAHAATEAGHATAQIVPIHSGRGWVREDNLIRAEMDPHKLASLRPAFDRRHGTITAASSSALTDGASAVLLMKESRAKALGYAPLGFLRSWHFPAIDPRENMLLGNVHSVPFALRKAGVSLDDIDVIEIHEAFAAQVLCNLAAMESAEYCRDVLGLGGPVGTVPRDKLNLWGGSLAYGHPFAATGGRMIGNALRLLQHVDGELAVATACAAGGLGAAVVLERAS